MSILIAGLAVFLGVHLVQSFPSFRASLINRLGEGGYKGLYSALSLISFAGIIYGYGLARALSETSLYVPPEFLKHLSFLFSAIGIFFLVATYLPSKLAERVKHPMIAGIKFWASGHLLANGMAQDVLLFGAFLVWAVIVRISLKRRERAGFITPRKTGRWLFDLVALLVTAVITAAFIYGLHEWLFGVAPLP